MAHQRGIIAAGHRVTAAAGAAMLRAGGNAVDAAVAAVTTSFCAEPVLTAAGGGGFMLVAAANQPARLYDGFARMPLHCNPSAATHLQPVPIDFGDTVQTFHIGPASVGTPSLLAMLFEAHRRHGDLPLREVVAPAIDAARNGVRLNRLQASFIALLEPILSATAACKALHAPHGTWLKEGDDFRNVDLANTLEMLAIDGIAEMYHGDLARAIVAACSPDGVLDMQDMRAKQVQVRTPLSLPLFSGTLLTNPPPASGGVLMGFSALLLDRLQQMPAISEESRSVILAEVLRAASDLRSEAFDAQIHNPDIALRTLSEAHIESRLEQLQQRLATIQGHAVQEPSDRHGSTTHISILDRNGMAVSVTTSNGEGSGIVVSGSGIHLNNMLGEEDINPLGFHVIDGGATLSSMMAPSVFMRHGRVELVAGSGGSNRLRGAILQVLVRALLHGESIESAVHAPRIHNESGYIDVEPGGLTDAEQVRLQQLGWQIRHWQQQSVYFGGVHAIARSAESVEACGDPRRGGAVEIV